MISERYLQEGKQQMDKSPFLSTDFDVEIRSTETAQEMSTHLKREEILPLLAEHPEFLDRVPRWPEDPKDDYFTLYWMTLRIFSEWLDDELELYGKEHLRLTHTS